MRTTESLGIENDRRGYQEVGSENRLWGIRIKEARINEVWLYSMIWGSLIQGHVAMIAILDGPVGSSAPTPQAMSINTSKSLPVLTPFPSTMLSRQCYELLAPSNMVAPTDELSGT